MGHGAWCAITAPLAAGGRLARTGESAGVSGDEFDPEKPGGEGGEWVTPRVAAGICGVSYVTVKNWILRGTLPTTRTPGGHHRIDLRELARFLPGARNAGAAKAGDSARAAALLVKPQGQVSGRNQLQGIITEVTVMGLLARVRLRLGDQTITSIITSDAVRALKLKKGERASALIKATEVMIARVD